MNVSITKYCSLFQVKNMEKIEMANPAISMKYLDRFTQYTVTHIYIFITILCIYIQGVPKKVGIRTF